MRNTSTSSSSSIPFGGAVGSEATTQRKLYIFDMISGFEKRGVTTVVLPCFLSHTFIDELKANSPLQIVDMVEASAAMCVENFRPRGESAC